MTSEELNMAVAELTLDVMRANGVLDSVPITEPKELQVSCPVCNKKLYMAISPLYLSPKSRYGFIFCRNSCLNDHMVWPRFLGSEADIHNEYWVEEAVEKFNTCVKDLAIRTYLPELWKEWLAPSGFTFRSDFKYTRDEMFEMAMKKKREEEDRCRHYEKMEEEEE